MHIRHQSVTFIYLSRSRISYHEKIYLNLTKKKQGVELMCTKMCKKQTL